MSARVIAIGLGLGLVSSAFAGDCAGGGDEYVFAFRNMRVDAGVVGLPFSLSYSGTLHVFWDANARLDGVELNGSSVPFAPAAGFDAVIDVDNGSIVGGAVWMTDESGDSYTAQIAVGSGQLQAVGSFYTFSVATIGGELAGANLMGQDVSFAGNQSGTIEGGYSQSYFVIRADGLDVDAALDITMSLCPPPCMADWNSDGTVSSPDAMGFLNSYLSGEARADVSGDGLVNGIDVGWYLKAYAAGC